MRCAVTPQLCERHRALRTWLLMAALAWSVAAAAQETGPPETPAISSTGASVSASALYDDNVTHTDSDGLSDESLEVAVSDGLVVPITPYWQSLFYAGAAVEQFNHWTGLSHADLTGRAVMRYRPSAVFYAPTISLSERITGSAYQVGLRSGARFVTEFSVAEPLTDRLDAFLALSHEERRAENSTFDGHDDSVRASFDYRPPSTELTLYGTLEHRYGDVVTTSFADPDNASLALAKTPDAAFGDTDRISYRIKGLSEFVTLGVNRPLGSNQALDLSWRRAEVFPARALSYYGATEAKYVDNLIVLSYLVRF